MSPGTPCVLYHLPGVTGLFANRSTQSFPFGWEDAADGFRGHVFLSPGNSTVILAIKGTTLQGPTSKKDKFKEYNYWRTHPFPYYKEIGALIGKSTATGRMAFSSVSGAKEANAPDDQDEEDSFLDSHSHGLHHSFFVADHHRKTVDCSADNAQVHEIHPRIDHNTYHIVHSERKDDAQDGMPLTAL